MSDPLKIGLLVGREWSFPPAFLEEIERRDQNVIAEYIRLGGTRMNEPTDYAVIVDRISHRVPYYRTYLKNAILQGASVVNDPFCWSADDKFFESSLASTLDIPTPRSVALPMKSYPPGVAGDSLRNLSYPLDWEDLVGYVGLPAILKDAWGGDRRHVYRVSSTSEVIAAYDGTGTLCMLLQELIETDQFVHCFHIGAQQALVIGYDPHERRYLVEQEGLTAELHAQIVAHTQRLSDALGYDVNRIEFAIRDGVPYAIDMLNPAPEIDVNSMTPRHFKWIVTAMANLCIELALNPRPPRDLRWGARGVSRPTRF